MGDVSLIEAIAVAAIAASGAVIGPYLIARFKGSGGVRTSEASTVFQAAADVIDRVDRDNERLREEIRELRQTERECKQELAALNRQIDELRRSLGGAAPG